jgi:putative transposase
VARPLRIDRAGAWHHVMSRANGGDLLFRDDLDRRRFLGLLSELPERFSLEIHAYVLMDNHYHLLLRCRESNLSQAIRWLQTSYAGRFNWAHRRRGHVFQGRFRSVLILDESRLDEVGRYLHLNPVRIAGLGLGKKDQRKARVLGCEDPGRELVSRRLATLDGYPWSSWRMYSGSDPAVPWLRCEWLLGGCGGKSLKERRRALRAFTESPIRQGVVESPWERLVGGVILGQEEEALRVLKEAGGDRREQTAVRRGGMGTRPEWEEMVKAAEGVLGRRWVDMILRHGDWGRDGLLAVATRHLGWRLSEVVEREPGVSYAAAAQGIRRFWKRTPDNADMRGFVKALLDKLSNG